MKALTHWLLLPQQLWEFFCYGRLLLPQPLRVSISSSFSHVITATVAVKVRLYESIASLLSIDECEVVIGRIPTRWQQFYDNYQHWRKGEVQSTQTKKKTVDLEPDSQTLGPSRPYLSSSDTGTCFLSELFRQLWFIAVFLAMRPLAILLVFTPNFENLSKLQKK